MAAKMECWPLSRHKSSLYWLLTLMMIAILLVRQIQGVCIEEEKMALLEIKASLVNSYVYEASHLLPTWVDSGSTVGGGGGECCDWERVKCNTTTGHVTKLSLNNLTRLSNKDYIKNLWTWPLNVSIFLHFEELRSLNLSGDYLNNGIVNKGLERLSSLKKLEMLDLSRNLDIDNDVLPSLGALTSLKILDLGHTGLSGHFPINEFAALENLEMLDLSSNGLNGTFQLQGFERFSILKKLKTLNLGNNHFNESLITSLSALPSLEALDLSWNMLSGSFPIEEFAALENLEMLDLSSNGLNGIFQLQGFERFSILKKLKTLNLGNNSFNESLITSLSALPISLEALDLSGNQLSGSFPVQELAHLTNLEKLDLNGTSSIQGCKSLSRLKRLESINLSVNNFNKSIISCLSALPSLKILDLSGSDLGSSFPIQELSGFRELEKLYLCGCGLNQSATFNGTMSTLLHLNLGRNDFSKDIMRSLGVFPSLRFLSLEYCGMGGALFVEDLPDLEVLLLGGNMLNGTLPMKALASFLHLETLDLSENYFVGSIPSAIRALSSLRVLSLAGNKLNGSLSEHGLCELKNLQELDLSRNMFEGSLPNCFNSLSSLKMLDISTNQFMGIISPSPIANLTSLGYVDFSHNKFEGSFLFSSFSNHTKLEVVAFESDNDKFEVETEEPLGWIPMFQLKVLVLSNCNMNRSTRSVVPGFLLHQHTLEILNLAHNSLEGHIPNWLIENNTMLQVLNLRNNLFGGISMPPFRHANMEWLDMSGNHMIGIPADTHNFLPHLFYLNLSGNHMRGALPSSIANLTKLQLLDLSDNEFVGEVPKGLLTNIPSLSFLKLSKNRLHGQVLSGNLSLELLNALWLDNNHFTGIIGNWTGNILGLNFLDISNNLFSGVIPGWISHLDRLSALVVRNNSFEGQFPCGTTSFSFLDISENSFSGSIPSCLNLQHIKHLHLESNKFTGSIPQSFRNLTNVLTLDMRNNNLSGRIPKFLGELSELRILLLGKNNFSGSIPKQICQLRNVSMMDLSSNYISGSIPRCLQNIIGPSDLAFLQRIIYSYSLGWSYEHGSLQKIYRPNIEILPFEKQDEVQFTMKSMSRPYKGEILDYMAGLDLSCNKLKGEIPKELGMLTQIRALNLSHNQLSGSIPMQFSNLAKIESLDLSSNGLSGKVPSQLIKLNFLAVFIVACNNLSGRLPEMKGQFSTFTKERYEGNPLLCGPPLEKKCTTELPMTVPAVEEGIEKWYDIDMACFYGSSISAWVVVLLGFVALLYTNPYWRRRWLDFIEECTYSCYYFLYDWVRKISMLLYK